MEFKATLPADLFNVFSISLDTLSDFGDNIYLDIRKLQFIISTMNNSETSQAIIRISPLIFENYKLLQRRSTEESLKCQVLAHDLNKIFKKNQSITNLIQSCGIQVIEDDENSAEARIHLTVKCHNGVTKKNTIWHSEGKTIIPFYSKDTLHSFIVDASIMKDHLGLFPPKVVDIVLSFTPQFIIIKSYWDNDSQMIHLGDKPVQTMVKMKVEDCVEYSVTEPVRLVFNFREFKAILNFMESMEAPLIAQFQEAGKPIIFTYEQSNEIMAEFALMTHANITNERSSYMSFNEHSMASIDSPIYGGHRSVSSSPPVQYHRRTASHGKSVAHPGRNSSVESDVPVNQRAEGSNLFIENNNNNNNYQNISTSAIANADTVPYTRPTTPKNPMHETEGSDLSFEHNAFEQSNHHRLPSLQNEENNNHPSSDNNAYFPFDSSTESSISAPRVEYGETDAGSSRKKHKSNFFS
ncbi:hypothetical protein RMCBS344292_09381 [Rhizopus microsporus]|nr:hypothetical protein RMCBS344292_09381 [Rhizopus microsporus]